MDRLIEFLESEEPVRVTMLQYNVSSIIAGHTIRYIEGKHIHYLFVTCNGNFLMQPEIFEYLVKCARMVRLIRYEGFDISAIINKYQTVVYSLDEYSLANYKPEYHCWWELLSEGSYNHITSLPPQSATNITISCYVHPEYYKFIPANCTVKISLMNVNHEIILNGASQCQFNILLAVYEFDGFDCQSLHLFGKSLKVLEYAITPQNKNAFMQFVSEVKHELAVITSPNEEIRDTEFVIFCKSFKEVCDIEKEKRFKRMKIAAPQ